MKYLIALVLLAPLFFTSKDAHATGPKVDSVYADSIYQVYALSDVQAKAALGKYDKQFATFTNGALLDLSFMNSHHNDIIPIKANSVLLIWGETDKTVDTSAGQVTFNIFDDLTGTLITSKRFILGDGLNVITVPNRDYAYIELSLADPVDPGSMTHSKSYLVDAVALVQDTTTKTSVPTAPILVSSLSSYPNPFISNTNIRFELKTEGDVQLAVVDALGRETDRIVTGYEESGMHEIPLAIKTPGFYFVRLFLNGQPIGTPLKITSR